MEVNFVRLFMYNFYLDLFLALKPLHEDSIAVDTNSETSNDEGTEGNVFDEPQTPRDDSCCGKATRLWNFMIEKEEYRDPQTHGWRIKFRYFPSNWS